MELNIEYLPVGELKPYDKNARKHAEYDVSQIMVSIKKYGFNDPIGVWGKDNVIIEGHGRLIAAKKLKMREVPVVHLDHLSDEERQEYGLIHNKSAELSEWDIDRLIEDIPTLDFSDFDIDWGLPDIENPADEDVEDDDFEPEPPEEPNSKLGQIYKLGNHRLMCGDSTKIEDVEKLVGGVAIDMVFTDPPWNVNYGAVEKGNAQGYKPRTIQNDFMGTEEFKQFMYSAFACMNAVSKPGAMTYVVMSAQEWGNMMLTLAQNDYHWSSTIIWNKDRLVLSRKDYHTKYEPIWYGWKEGEARLHPLEDRKQSDVWDFERPRRSDEHPTMKPIPLVARAIQNSSNRGDNILDLFGGSGTTMMAAEKTGRNSFLMELDPKYVDVIIDRWEKLTGQKAELIDG